MFIFEKKIYIDDKIKEWKKEKRWRKRGRKRHDEMLKVKIGGWKYKWRNSAPLV